MAKVSRLVHVFQECLHDFSAQVIWVLLKFLLMFYFYKFGDILMLHT